MNDIRQDDCSKKLLKEALENLDVMDLTLHLEKNIPSDTKLFYRAHSTKLLNILLTIKKLVN